MTAQEILRMIETVSPDDEAGLDEIDARVWKYLSRYSFENNYFDNNGYQKDQNDIPQYTRSRNALKAIRPEGWAYESRGLDSWSVRLRSQILLDETFNKIDVVSIGPTEELAELHAIISAIEYERAQK